jgi:hypothetical protein
LYKCSSGGKGRRKQYAEIKKVSLGKEAEKSANVQPKKTSQEVWPEPRK